MGLEILPLFQESTDSLAAAHMWAESRLPVPVVLWHSTHRGCPLRPPRTHLHPHCSDPTTSLGPGSRSCLPADARGAAFNLLRPLLPPHFSTCLNPGILADVTSLLAVLISSVIPVQTLSLSPQETVCFQDTSENRQLNRKQNGNTSQNCCSECFPLGGYIIQFGHCVLVGGGAVSFSAVKLVPRIPDTQHSCPHLQLLLTHFFPLKSRPCSRVAEI